MTKHIMLQGTSSHVGKSILTTALCRIFHQEGVKVVPFKAQNMALNSYVTKDGDEMGRAQVAQAEAAGLEPFVEMNPVLLKPTGNSRSQVILMGKPIGNMSAKEYHQGYSLKAFDTVKEAINRLHKKFDLMIIEGAGSPAEVNLKANDIVNMRIARYLKAPVFLIADIDRGGALASLVGTLELLEPEERDLVKGLIINKFRGDVTILQPALDFLEEKTGKPVLGVIPHLDNLGIDDEDSVSLEEKSTSSNDTKDIKISVIQLPKISNFTDFSALSQEYDVDLYYVKSVEELKNPDLIIIPGSKNTTEDLLYLRNSGLEKQILKKHDLQIPIIGICGGYQMLGEYIHDPFKTESDNGTVKAIGLLPMQTKFAKTKLTSQVKLKLNNFTFLGYEFTSAFDNIMRGYEIHMGETNFTDIAKSPFTILERSDSKCEYKDGLVNSEQNVMGSYVHGIFDNDNYRHDLINILRQRKNLPPREKQLSFAAKKEAAYNRLAATVQNSLDMKKVYQILQEQGS